ncbi:MAG TPA: nitroreductase family deazaflavin-dependent oxidoreductase [Jatrophihabitans sp.]|nr:nitroreductase family deazaflavin-dependent oxidoreductase [Jatrophihabitans sp.]
MARAPWTAPPGWLRLFNKVNIGMQRLGVPLGPTQVLTVRGRTSGKPRTTPVTPLTVDGRRYVIGGFANGDWVANARMNGAATLRHGRRTENIELVELPESERGPIMRAFPTEVPRGVSFFVKTGAVEAPTPEAFERGAAKVAVFRIEPR